MTRNLTVRDLLEVYQIKTESDSISALWVDMDCNIDERVDKTLLFSIMLEECGVLYPRYNTTEVFQSFSENFFNAKAAIITRRLDTLYAHYDFLKDYDMQVDENTATNQRTTALTQSDATSSSDSTSEHTTSAYDSDEYQPRDKNTVGAENTSASTVDGVGTLSQGVAHGKHEYGRKGSGQELVKEELEIAEEMDIYHYICDMYSRHLCLNLF